MIKIFCLIYFLISCSWAQSYKSINTNLPNLNQQVYSYGDQTFSYTPSTTLILDLSKQVTYYPCNPLTCRTSYPIYFQFVLDFDSQLFTQDHLDIFQAQIVSFGQYPSWWTFQQKKRYFELHSVLKDSLIVMINGTIYFPDEMAMNTTMNKFIESFSTLEKNIGGIPIDSVLFFNNGKVRFSNSTNQDFLLNWTHNQSIYSNCHNKNSSQCPSLLKQPKYTSSSSKMISFIVFAGIGMLMIVVAMLVYFWKWKKTIIKVVQNDSTNKELEQSDPNDMEAKEYNSLNSSSEIQSFTQTSNPIFIHHNQDSET